MRRLTSMLIFVSTFVFLAGACGAGDTEPIDVGAAPTAERSPDTTAPPSADDPLMQVTIYFVKDDKLIPATRTIACCLPSSSTPPTDATGKVVPGDYDAGLAPAAAGAIDALLRGPTPAEQSGGFTTFIPERTRSLGVEIADRIATVNLSKEFQRGGDSASMKMRLAQVACTIDNVIDLDIADGTRFLIDGEPVKVFSGAGIVLDDPVTCAHYSDLLR